MVEFLQTILLTARQLGDRRPAQGGWLVWLGKISVSPAEASRAQSLGRGQQKT